MSGYDRLRIAILLRAAADYKIALRKRDEKNISILKRWFTRGWGDMLCDGKGAIILEQIHKGVDLRRSWYRKYGKEINQ